MSETVELTANGARARIAVTGAEPVAWSAGGRELIWEADAVIWARTSPVLFPVVGRANDGVVRVNGRTYPMGIHGFASERRFEVIERADDRVRLALTDDARTRASYPFGFRLAIEYRLDAASLFASFEVANTGDEPMPYALGLHPGFRWPFAGGSRDGYTVEFEVEETPEVPVITPAGLVSRERRSVPLEGRHLPLDDMLMSREALCFLDARSRAVRFRALDGSAVRVEVEDFPHFALWSRPPAPFLCIEAWTGYGDPDGFDGELTEKPSMRILEAGASARHGIVMRYEAAP